MNWSVAEFTLSIDFFVVVELSPSTGVVNVGLMMVIGLAVKSVDEVLLLELSPSPGDNLEMLLCNTTLDNILGP